MSNPPVVTVPCNHCGSVGTYKTASSNGETAVSCKSCHKTFRIEIRNGQIYKTMK